MSGVSYLSCFRVCASRLHADSPLGISGACSATCCAAFMCTRVINTRSSCMQMPAVRLRVRVQIRGLRKVCLLRWSLASPMPPDVSVASFSVVLLCSSGLRPPCALRELFLYVPRALAHVTSVFGHAAAESSGARVGMSDPSPAR